MSFEVIIPLRNPTDVFLRTAESLAGQTVKDFTVVISDNFSTKGKEFLDRALEILRAGGIVVRKIQPPTELGRVEHWNWLHYQSTAEWVKPLFAGDWLESDYIAEVRGIIIRDQRCAYIFCGYQLHRKEGVATVLPQWSAGRYSTPEEMQDIVLRYAMQFGPPSAAAYRRESFVKTGGYEPTLPICADCLFFCKLAARHGGYGMARAGVNFFIHAARFSSELPGKRRETFRETFRYLADLGLSAWYERWRFPVGGYVRLLLREFRTYWKND